MLKNSIDYTRNNVQVVAQKSIVLLIFTILFLFASTFVLFFIYILDEESLESNNYYIEEQEFLKDDLEVFLDKNIDNIYNINIKMLKTDIYIDAEDEQTYIHTTISQDNISPNDVAISEDFAQKNNLSIGDSITVEYTVFNSDVDTEKTIIPKNYKVDEIIEKEGIYPYDMEISILDYLESYPNEKLNSYFFFSSNENILEDARKLVVFQENLTSSSDVLHDIKVYITENISVIIIINGLLMLVLLFTFILMQFQTMSKRNSEIISLIEIGYSNIKLYKHFLYTDFIALLLNLTTCVFIYIMVNPFLSTTLNLIYNYLAETNNKFLSLKYTMPLDDAILNVCNLAFILSFVTIVVIYLTSNMLVLRSKYE